MRLVVLEGELAGDNARGIRSDIAYDGTRYVVGALASNTSSIVTGQFSFQNYEAHIAYLAAKYRF